MNERSSSSFLVALGAALALNGCADVHPPNAAGPLDLARNDDTMVSDGRPSRPTFERTSGAKHPSDAAQWKASERGANAPRAVRGSAASSGALDYERPLPALDPSAPAIRYADLSEAACLKEVARRKLPVRANPKAARGVETPMRLDGPLHGVRVVTPPASSPNGVLDCRLALALDDLAATLSRLDVTTIRVDNFYRDGAHLPGKKAKSQHAYALAVDLTSIELASGRALTPESDWHAAIGSTSCGPDAVMEDPTAESITLRNMVCEVAREGLFHHLLTPSFNAAHRTHFHFDLQAGQTRQSMR